MMMNGIGFDYWFYEFFVVGLDWVNILLDMVNFAYFVWFMRCDWLESVLDGICVAWVVGILSLKFNVVMMCEMFGDVL